MFKPIFLALSILTVSSLSAADDSNQDLNEVLKNAKLQDASQTANIQQDQNSQNDGQDQQQPKRFEKLGFKRSEAISVNNQDVDTPAKAMELYNQSKENGNDSAERPDNQE